MMKLPLLFTFVPMLALAAKPFGADQLAALSMIESGNNDHMVGRAGEISRYQIFKSEWHSVTNCRQYTDRETARVVALRLLGKRIQSFEASFNRKPTAFEIYGLWNAPAQVMRGRVSRCVAERCQRYANLCGEFQPRAQVGSATRRTTA